MYSFFKNTKYIIYVGLLSISAKCVGYVLNTTCLLMHYILNNSYWSFQTSVSMRYMVTVSLLNTLATTSVLNRCKYQIPQKRNSIFLVLSTGLHVQSVPMFTTLHCNISILAQQQQFMECSVSQSVTTTNPNFVLLHWKGTQLMRRRGWPHHRVLSMLHRFICNAGKLSTLEWRLRMAVAHYMIVEAVLVTFTLFYTSCRRLSMLYFAWQSEIQHTWESISNTNTTYFSKM